MIVILILGVFLLGYGIARKIGERREEILRENEGRIIGVTGPVGVVSTTFDSRTDEGFVTRSLLR